MAKIHEECVTVRFSILARNDEVVKKNFVSDEQIALIDETLKAVMEDVTGMVVEVERSEG
jgi:hypothetical protein